MIPQKTSDLSPKELEELVDVLMSPDPPGAGPLSKLEETRYITGEPVPSDVKERLDDEANAEFRSELDKAREASKRLDPTKFQALFERGLRESFGLPSSSLESLLKTMLIKFKDAKGWVDEKLAGAGRQLVADIGGSIIGRCHLPQLAGAPVGWRTDGFAGDEDTCYQSADRLASLRFKVIEDRVVVILSSDAMVSNGELADAGRVVQLRSEPGTWRAEAVMRRPDDSSHYVEAIIDLPAPGSKGFEKNGVLVVEVLPAN